MRSLRRRAGAAFAVLVLLFLAAVLAQLVIVERLQHQRESRSARLERASDANQAALQHLTDAETGVRGYQLTRDRVLLEPYEHGRGRAFTALDAVVGHSHDGEVQRLLGEQRRAAQRWLDGYAYPVVNGAALTGTVPVAAGKRLFDQVRAANAAVAGAIDAEQAAAHRADRRAARAVQFAFTTVALLLLALALVLAVLGSRQLVAPLEHLRRTLHRLAGGELSARAVPSGPAEVRAVAHELNRLAARTEALIEAEAARTARSELRRRVAAELRGARDAAGPAARTVELVGAALGAGAVHVRIAVGADQTVTASWPPGAAPLPEGAERAVLATPPGTAVAPAAVPGALAVALDGDDDCAPGLLCVVRPDRPFTADERALVLGLGREVDHAVGALRVQRRQARLISELRFLDERKDTFVATVTHELRTPLTSILGYAELLADDDGTLPAPQRRGAQAILRNAHRLHDTVADLLLLDRTNRPARTATPVDVAAVLSGVHAELDPAARTRGLDLGGECTPARVAGDARQLRRALRNLLDNAVKFTPPGGRVHYRLAHDGEQVVVTVADTGIGIPAEDLPGVFTPFHRAANAVDGAVQGSGLGLAIVHDIVTEHGGAVAVRSRPGEGTTVTVRLPAHPGDGPGAAGG